MNMLISRWTHRECLGFMTSRERVRQLMLTSSSCCVYYMHNLKETRSHTRWGNEWNWNEKFILLRSINQARERVRCMQRWMWLYLFIYSFFVSVAWSVSTAVARCVDYQPLITYQVEGSVDALAFYPLYNYMQVLCWSSTFSRAYSLFHLFI